MRKTGQGQREQYGSPVPLTAGVSSGRGSRTFGLRRAAGDREADSPGGRRRELLALFRLAVRRQVPADPKSNPGMDTRSIDCPSTRSIVRTMAISSGAMNVKASPVCAARPVRPMRWT